MAKSFVWVSILSILVIELVIVTILCAPLPWGVRKNVARFLLNTRQTIQNILKYIAFGLSIAIIESTVSMYNLNQKIESDDDKEGAGDPNQGLIAVSTLKIRRIRAERNLYMASFSMVLIVVIGRLVHLVANEMELKNRIKALGGTSEDTKTHQDPSNIVMKKAQ